MFTTSLLVRKCKQKHASFFGHTCASSAAASKRKSSLNGNDKNATLVSADSAKAKGASGPTAQSPAPVAKKQRMTKKQKIEQEKKKVCMLIVAF